VYTSPWTEFELTTLVVIGTDCKGSCKSNYHTITTTTAPSFIWSHVIEWNLGYTFCFVLKYCYQFVFVKWWGLKNNFFKFAWHWSFYPVYLYYLYEWKIFSFLDNFVIVIVIYYIFIWQHTFCGHIMLRVWLFSVLLLSSAQYNNFSYSKPDLYAIFSSPCQRQCELLPSLVVR